MKMTQYRRGDKVSTSLGITGRISQVVFSKESGQPYIYIVTLDNAYNGAYEIVQSTMQLTKLGE